MENLRILRQLVEVANASSYRKAAKKLGITHSALSQSMKKLEENYGVTLFDRQKGATVPTAFGAVLVSAARDALSGLESARREIESMQGMEVGRLVVGSDATVSEAIVGPVLLGMYREYPGLRFTVVSQSWRTMEDALRDRRIDVFVGPMPDVQGDDIHYATYQFPAPIVVCRADHPLTRKVHVSFDDFFAFRHVGLDVPDWYFHRIMNALPELEAGVDDMRDFFLTAHEFSLSRLFLLGTDVVAVVPRPVVEEQLADGRLVELAMVDNPIRGQLPGTVASLASRQLPPAAALFSQEVLAMFANEPEAA